MPDGEVSTAPIENSMEGTVRFAFPGLYTERKGEVVEASAVKGEELLREALKVKGANRLGELGIGTKYTIKRFVKNMLFDEEMGGTMHMALDNSLPESGDRNTSPTLHLYTGIYLRI